MYNTILVAHDASEIAEHALCWAEEFVRAAGGSIHLVRVVPLPPPVAMPVPAYSPFPGPEDLEIAKAQLKEVAERHGLTATTHVLVANDLGEGILGTARKAGATLIVMGTHGRGGFKRAVLGSVADYVVRHADCPVVTVRKPEATAA
jgi:nucleotide-binding universal stress UspA family protein